jgi:hypothetical protein
MPSAISMLFSAHHDRDDLRIAAAMRHLESLDWRERMANNLCTGGAKSVSRKVSGEAMSPVLHIPEVTR